jgi:hypothetical protein
MKQIIYILTLLFIASCGQSNLEQKITTVADTISTDNDVKDTNEYNQSEDDYRKQSLSGFEKATLYKLTDTITADFNGDGVVDKAFYKKENETSGIIIKHGKTNEEIRIGFGKNFSTWSDDFDCNWVDYWGVVEDKETSETTFTEDGDVLGSKEVKLQNPSIVIGKDEVGGGLITFLKGKYVWIHQTC